MSDKLHQYIEDFPRLFENGTPSLGLTVGSGWRRLLRDLCSKIDKELPEDHDFSILEVSESFGELRFYVNLGSLPEEKAQRIEKLINEAKDRSLKTCEFCGQEGGETISCSGWYKTLCEEHRQSMSAKAVEIIRCKEKLG